MRSCQLHSLSVFKYSDELCVAIWYETCVLHCVEKSSNSSFWQYLLVFRYLFLSALAEVQRNILNVWQLFLATIKKYFYYWFRHITYAFTFFFNVLISSFIEYEMSKNRTKMSIAVSQSSRLLHETTETYPITLEVKNQSLSTLQCLVVPRWNRISKKIF